MGFTTSVGDRTPKQRHNAKLAAQELEGKTLAPGDVFSFNDTVKGWSPDRGYVKAPVSYDGELIPAFGGGVCQTSTALYNASLLAGLEIVERHPHVFAPHYVPPGRDAAVAYPGIDLKVRNPYLFALKIHTNVDKERLTVEFWGRGPVAKGQLRSDFIGVQVAGNQVRHLGERGPKSGFARREGTTGFRVLTYRVLRNKQEMLSDDSYPAMPNVMAFSR